MVQYAGGVNLYYASWIGGATGSMNNAFPRLLRAGPNGIVIAYCQNIATMTGAFPALSQVDGQITMYVATWRLFVDLCFAL